MVRTGKIKEFTGISDPYEIPQNPEITIDTSKVSIEDGMALLFEKLVEMGIVAK